MWDVAPCRPEDPPPEAGSGNSQATREKKETRRQRSPDRLERSRGAVRKQRWRESKWTQQQQQQQQQQQPPQQPRLPEPPHSQRSEQQERHKNVLLTPAAALRPWRSKGSRADAVTDTLRAVVDQIDGKAVGPALCTLWKELFRVFGGRIFGAAIGSHGSTGQINSQVLCDVTATEKSVHGGRKEFRDLLPLPNLSLSIHGELLGGMQQGLNWLFGECEQVPESLSTSQELALNTLAGEVGKFLDRYHGSLVSVGEEVLDLDRRGVSYEGSEVYCAETYTWGEIEPALPGPGLAGRVAAADFCSPTIRDLLCAPARLLNPPAEVVLPARTPTVWCSDAEWNVCAVELVRRGILAPISESSIYTHGGRMVLNGLFGVKKSGQEGVKRLIMNLTPSNCLQNPIVADMTLLPHYSQWANISLADGQVLLWSSEDLRCAFYLFHLPEQWQPFMTISKPIPGRLLGLEATQVYLTCRVLPMGWVSACGILQHVHRRLLLSSPTSLLSADREIRKDTVLPVLKSCSEDLWNTSSLDDKALLTEQPFTLLWQIYIDNLDVIELCPEGAISSLVNTLSEQIARARELYEQSGVVLSANKAVSRQLQTSSLGVAVDGVQGVISAPSAAMGRLVGLTLYVLALRVIPRKHLQILAGRWVRFLVLNRPTMAQSMGCFSELWRVL
eukprot:6492090-Amphidinium_carterae.2